MVFLTRDLLGKVIPVSSSSKFSMPFSRRTQLVKLIGTALLGYLVNDVYGLVSTQRSVLLRCLPYVILLSMLGILLVVLRYTEGRELALPRTDSPGEPQVLLTATELDRTMSLHALDYKDTTPNLPSRSCSLGRICDPLIMEDRHIQPPKRLHSIDHQPDVNGIDHYSLQSGDSTPKINGVYHALAPARSSWTAPQSSKPPNRWASMVTTTSAPFRGSSSANTTHTSTPPNPSENVFLPTSDPASACSCTTASGSTGPPKPSESVSITIDFTESVQPKTWHWCGFKHEMTKVHCSQVFPGIFHTRFDQSEAGEGDAENLAREISYSIAIAEKFDEDFTLQMGSFAVKHGGRQVKLSSPHATSPPPGLKQLQDSVWERYSPIVIPLIETICIHGGQPSEFERAAQATLRRALSKRFPIARTLFVFYTSGRAVQSNGQPYMNILGENLVLVDEEMRSEFTSMVIV